MIPTIILMKIIYTYRNNNSLDCIYFIIILIRRYLMMKFSFILIHGHSNRYRNKPIALRGAYFNLWKLINMKESLHRVLNANNSVEIMDPFLDRSWQVQKSQLIRDSRFPLMSLSKLRKSYEEARFDWERKKQWKQRFFTLFNAILRNNRRRMR